MRHYLLLSVKTIFLLITLAASFGLLFMRKTALFIANHYRMITGTDPMGARQVVQGSMKVVIWVVGKIRGLIADYVRNYHRTAWLRLRDYIAPRR